MLKRTTEPALALIALSLLCSSSAAPTDPRPPARSALEILLEMGRLADAERRLLTRGGAVVKILDTDDRSEILAFAAVKVNTTSGRALD